MPKILRNCSVVIVVGFLVAAVVVSKSAWDTYVCGAAIAAVVGVIADRIIPRD